MRLWWRRGAVAVAAVGCLAAGQRAAASTPAFALLDRADSAQWETWAKVAGWQVIAPPAGLAADAAIDVRAQALAAAVQGAIPGSGGEDRKSTRLNSSHLG